jgi:putative DNA primase/helicase
MREIAELAQGKWRGILPRLGVDTKFLSGRHSPCPACDGVDRFRFDDRNGRGDFYCSGCGAGDGLELLKRVNGWTFSDAADQVRAIVGEVQPTKGARKPMTDEQAMARCKTLWDGAREIGRGDPVADYLGARGLTGPFSTALRFHPACPISGVDGIKQLPAMLALVRAPDGKPATVHRTYLGDRCKADVPSPRRIMPGHVPEGSAIRLGPLAPYLGVAEGIETAMAVTRDFGRVCWSVISKDMLAKFQWPGEVKQLAVFGDNDANFAGQAGAYALAHRAAVAKDGPEVLVCLPRKVGEDYLDQGNRIGAK